jgi:hypothetical protein
VTVNPPGAMASDVLVAVQDDLCVADAVADAPGPVGFAARTAVDVAKRTGDAVTEPGASWTTCAASYDRG